MKKILIYLSIVFLFYTMGASESWYLPAQLPSVADSAQWIIRVNGVQRDSTDPVRTDVQHYDTTITINNDSVYTAILKIWWPGEDDCGTWVFERDKTASGVANLLTLAGGSKSIARYYTDLDTLFIIDDAGIDTIRAVVYYHTGGGGGTAPDSVKTFTSGW